MVTDSHHTRDMTITRDRNRNANGSFRTDASAKSLAPFYGEDVLRQLAYLSEVPPVRWSGYLSSIGQQARIAAHYGRIALRHSKPSDVSSVYWD